MTLVFIGMFNVEGPVYLVRGKNIFSTETNGVTIHRKESNKKVKELNGSKCHFKRNCEPVMSEKGKITSNTKYNTTIWFPI